MKKILIALLVLLMALVVVACKQDVEEEEDPGHVHVMEQCGAVYHCTECDKYYEDEAGTVKLTKISTAADLVSLCSKGGKGVLLADITGESLVDSIAYPDTYNEESGEKTETDQLVVFNVTGNVTLYDDGTARTIKRTSAVLTSDNTKAKFQFFEVCDGGSLNIVASSAGKIIIDGGNTEEVPLEAAGNSYLIRVNGGGAANLANVTIQNVKNSGTGSTIRLDHSKGNMSCTMTNCTIQNCSTSKNGGVMTDTGDSNTATLYFKGCTFSTCSCANHGGVAYFTGSGSDLTLEGCTFTSITNGKSNNILCVNSKCTYDLTLVGTNTVETTEYPAAAKTTYGSADSRVYWP